MIEWRALPDITISDELFSRAQDLIPAGTGAGQFVRGVAPKYLQRGKGCRVWDVDGNEYIDLIMAGGPISLGYGYDAVDDAIRQQLSEGIIFSLMHPLELEVAEMIRDLVPGAEGVRFSKTVADVTSDAVRLACAFTGRSNILCCGYHGLQDQYISPTNRHRGLTYTFEYNNLASFEKYLDESIACVILEPVLFEEPRDDFLQQVRRLCTKKGALLIFDEMWTGFRIALGGAQQYFGLTADLAFFSNALANGMPLSVLTGRRDIIQLLEKDVFSFQTFGGETLSLSAAEATLEELKKKEVPQHIAHWNNRLRNGYNRIAYELNVPYTRCIGLDYRTIITFDASAGNPLEMKSLVQQELIRHGVLWNGFHNLSASHQYKDISHVLSAYADALSILKCAVETKQVRQLIQGEPVEPMFRNVPAF